MIRRLLIPTIATCAALAAGVALGAGPLDNATHAQGAATTRPDRAALQEAAFGQRWATQAATSMLAGRLSGRRIALVTLPGADPAVVRGLLQEIAVAHGTVSAKVSATPAILDPHQQTMLSTLGERFAQESHGTVPTGLPTYARLGALLGVAVAGPAATTTTVTTKHTKHGVRRIVHHVASPVSRTTAQETLRAGRLATVSGVQDPATLALVVLGDRRLPASALHDLLAGLGTQLTGLVVAGDAHSAAKGGTLAALRATKDGDKVLTVDGVDTSYGRIAAVLGLVRQLGARGGDFGASGADGLLP